MLIAVLQSLNTIKKFATHSATLSLTNETIGKHVEERTRELARSREQYRLIAETTRAIPFELDLAHGRFTYIGPQAQKMLGFPESQWKEPEFLDVLLPRSRESDVRQQLDECMPGTFETLCCVVTADNRVVELRWTVACELVNDMRFLRGLMIDVTEARRMVRELAQGQKLESVGRIAAGVAHEINTSVQFISDSVRFVRHALRDVPHALADYRALAASALVRQGRDRGREEGRRDRRGRGRRLLPQERAGCARSRARRHRPRGLHRAFDDRVRASRLAHEGRHRPQPRDQHDARTWRATNTRASPSSKPTSATSPRCTATPATSTRSC